MTPIASTSATVTNASAANPGTVQGAAAITVMKKAIDQQATSAMQLIQALPQPQLATSGHLGTQLNAFA